MAGVFSFVPAFFLLLAVQPDLLNAQNSCRSKSARADLTVFTDAAKGITGHRDGDEVKVTKHFEGLMPGVDHGFHIHEIGSTDQNCVAAGAHFNPNGENHAFPDKPHRHVGDFSNNVRGNDQGVFHSERTFFPKRDKNALTLCGPNNVIGRTIVLHLKQDDGGLTNDPMSKTTGNSGARIACGIIKELQS